VDDVAPSRKARSTDVGARQRRPLIAGSPGEPSAAGATRSAPAGKAVRFEQIFDSATFNQALS